MGKVVFVDVNAQLGSNILPPKYSKKRKIYPYVYVTDNSLQREFAFFQHSTLKTQEFSKIFRDTKSAIRSARKDGTLHSGAVKADAPAENGTDSPITKFENADFQSWTSAKGSTIEAKLVSFYKGSNSFEFQLRNGQTITVTAAELDAESATRAKELLNAL